jgi:formamidase
VSERWHNRWHPEIEPVARVASGETFSVRTREGTDGVIRPGSTHGDLLRIDLGRSHQLAGPYSVEGAEAGDVLDVELIRYVPASFGFTAILPGFGVLADLFTEPYLVPWTLQEGIARTPELPGVAVPDATFCGVIGVAPSHELMSRQRRREDVLREAGGPVASDQPEGAVPASAADGLRTIPPRENGGNIDIRQLGAGSRVRLPVFVDGALLSFGDVHFAQGDGEVCGTGIETSAEVTLRATVIKAPGRLPRSLVYETGPQRTRSYFATTGIGVNDDDVNGAMDVSLAARNALLEMLDYLCHTYGFARESAYALMSATVDLRISQLVNVPNPLVSALLPLDIFSESPGAHRQSGPVA